VPTRPQPEILRFFLYLSMHASALVSRSVIAPLGACSYVEALTGHLSYPTIDPMSAIS